MKQVTFVSYEQFDGIDTVVPEIDLAPIIHNGLHDDGILCHLVNPNYLKKTEAEEKVGI